MLRQLLHLRKTQHWRTDFRMFLTVAVTRCARSSSLCSFPFWSLSVHGELLKVSFLTKEGRLVHPSTFKVLRSRDCVRVAPRVRCAHSPSG